MIDIRTAFTPFKMKISRKEPVSLSIELVNSGQEPEIVSLDLMLGSLFSFEKSGFKNEKSEKIPELKPGESKKFYYDVWPKQMLRKGEHGIRLTIIEHYKGFNYVKRKYNKVLRLAVED
jgi:uncharacterized membrane protein